MSTAVQSCISQVQVFAGGVDPVAAVNEITNATLSGTWVAGDEWTIILQDQLSGLQTQIGFGYASGVLPTFAMTFDNKVYVLAGADVYFSAADEPTTFNDPNGLGNGFLPLNNWNGTAETLVAMAPFQGYMAFFSRWTIQIWSVVATPSNWQIIQILPNIGAVASASVQPVGDLDVLFLSDTGYRSLRPQVTTLNAFINDIGSPVDAFVVASLKANTATANAAACSIVEPSTRQFWGYLNGVIYVLSDYASNKIVAWSTYLPIDSTEGAFTIRQFVVFQGQVYCLGQDANGSTAIWQYGGANNDTYDATVCEVVLPFMDAKLPAIDKQARAFDLVINSEYPSLLDGNNAAYAQWTLEATMDPQNVDGNNFPIGFGKLPVYIGDKSTYDVNDIPYADIGTHVAMKLKTSGVGPATLSSITFHFDIDEEKG